MSNQNETKLMYTQKDIDLLKSVFADNDILMSAIRKLFFGVDISEYEQALIKDSFENPEIVDVFRKRVYGLNNFNTPIGQLSDFWLGAETQVFGASRDTIYQVYESKKMVFGMFEKAFKLLTNLDGEKVDITSFPDTTKDPLQVWLIARNLYMKAVETALLNIKTVAGAKEESAEEAIKRLTKDSNK